MNKIILIGNLTRDPELKYTSNGIATAAAGLAVNRNYKNEAGERVPDFFNLTCWRERAEFLSQYGHKGNKIAVEGRMQSRKYTTQDGVEKQVWEVQVDNIELLTPKGENGQQGQGAAPQERGFTPAPVPTEESGFSDPFSE